jgi:uncharacterized membrane protein
MFSIEESIKYGWRKLKENMELSLLTTFLVLVVSGLGGGIGSDNHSIIILLSNLIVFVFLIIIKIGYTKIFLRMHDGEKPRFLEIFDQYGIFWRYIGTSILVFLPIAILGLLIYVLLIEIILSALLLSFITLDILALMIALIIAASVFWVVILSFSLLIVIDDKIGPVAAIKESYAITKGNFWKILLFFIVIGLINLLGLLLFWVGLLITVPVSTFASIYVYRELSKAKAGLMQEPSPQAV